MLEKKELNKERFMHGKCFLFITPAKEVMFSPICVSACTFVCWLVCQQDYAKTTKQIPMKLG